MFSVVVPNYNGLHFLKKSLESLMLIPKYLRQDVEIIVIDNGSRDGSRKYLSRPKVEGKVKVIFNNLNLGFAGAVNQGIKAAENDWVVVMNNDVKIKKDWFVKIKKELSRPEVEDEQVGCLFGKVLDWEGERIESVGLDFEIMGKSKNIGNGDNDIENYNQSRFIWGAPASIVVYRKKALKEVGYFDDDFFAYLEDVDLAIRLNDKNWQTLYVPKAVSYHYGGGTADKFSGWRQKYTARNWWYIIVKHYPVRVVFGHLAEILIEQAKNFLAIKGFADKFWVIKEFVVNFKKIWRKRKPKKLGAS
jgi:GT2 family glycosyltransferase